MDTATDGPRPPRVAVRPFHHGLAAVVLLLALLAGQLLVVGVAPAAAHGGTSGGLLPVVDEVTLDLDGLDVRVEGITGDLLVVEHAGATPVEVVGEDGRAFLRVSRDGVEADLSAPGWYATADPDGVVAAPDDVDLGGPATWTRVSDSPRWAFADHRLHPGDLVLAPSVLGGGEVVDVAPFVVPLRHGADRGEVRGRLRFVPPLGGYVAALDDPAAAPAGVTLAVLPGLVPGFFVDGGDLEAGQTLVVHGAAGEPYLRVTASGVEANAASPTWQRHTVLASAQAPSSVTPDAEAPPAWTAVAAVPRFGWLDERMTAGLVGPPDDPDRRQDVLAWSVAVERDGVVTTLGGTTRWEPSPVVAVGEEGGSLVWAVAVGAAGLALAGIALLRRRRPSRGGTAV